MHTKRRSIFLAWVLTLLFGLFTMPMMAEDVTPQQPPIEQITQLQAQQLEMNQKLQQLQAAQGLEVPTEIQPGEPCPGVPNTTDLMVFWSDDVKDKNGWPASTDGAYLKSNSDGIPVGCRKFTEYGLPLTSVYGKDPNVNGGLEYGEVGNVTYLFTNNTDRKMFENPVFPFNGNGFGTSTRVVLREAITDTQKIWVVAYIDANGDGGWRENELVTGALNSLIAVSLPESPLNYGFDFLWEQGAKDFTLNIPYGQMSITAWWQDESGEWWTGNINYEATGVGVFPLAISLKALNPKSYHLYLPLLSN